MLFFMQMVDIVLQFAKSFLSPYLVLHDRLPFVTGMRILSDSACRGQGSGVVDIQKVTDSAEQWRFALIQWMCLWSLKRAVIWNRILVKLSKKVKYCNCGINSSTPFPSNNTLNKQIFIGILQTTMNLIYGLQM